MKLLLILTLFLTSLCFAAEFNLIRDSRGLFVEEIEINNKTKGFLLSQKNLIPKLRESLNSKSEMYLAAEIISHLKLNEMIPDLILKAREIDEHGVFHKVLLLFSHSESDKFIEHYFLERLGNFDSSGSFGKSFVLAYAKIKNRVLPLQIYFSLIDQENPILKEIAFDVFYLTANEMKLTDEDWQKLSEKIFKSSPFQMRASYLKSLKKYRRPSSYKKFCENDKNQIVKDSCK